MLNRTRQIIETILRKIIHTIEVKTNQKKTEENVINMIESDYKKNNKTILKINLNGPSKSKANNKIIK